MYAGRLHDGHPLRPKARGLRYQPLQEAGHVEPPVSLKVAQRQCDTRRSSIHLRIPGGCFLIVGNMDMDARPVGCVPSAPAHRVLLPALKGLKLISLRQAAKKKEENHQTRRRGPPSPVRRKGDEAHEDARNQSGHGHRDEPAEVDPRHHAPVDGTPVAVAEADADNGARDALGGGDGEFCASGRGQPCGQPGVPGRARRLSGRVLPSRVAMMTVMTEPSSMEKPRDGDMRVTRLPRLRMMW